MAEGGRGSHAPGFQRRQEREALATGRAFAAGAGADESGGGGNHGREPGVKKKSWGIADKCRFSAQEKEQILAYVEQTRSRSQVQADWILQRLGLSRALYYRWLKRQVGGQLEDSRSEEHTSELQSRPHLVCRLLLEKKKKIMNHI